MKASRHIEPDFALVGIGAVVVEVCAEIVVVVPLLIFAVPPLVDGLVAMLALFAQIFLALGGFMAVLSVFGDRLIELSFGLLGVALAFCELIGGVKSRSAQREHQNRGGCRQQPEPAASRRVQIAM